MKHLPTRKLKKETMKTLKKFIEEAIGIPLPMLIPKGIELFPLDNPSKTYLFGSAVARERLYLLQSDIQAFIENSPVGYFLLGHWGHGVNTYNLYYCRHDEWSRIFLRLHIGGVYTDNKRAAQRIREFLPKFFVFENTMRYNAQSFLAVESGGGIYKITLFSGKTYELKKSLYHNPDFRLIFDGEEDENVPLL